MIGEVHLKTQPADFTLTVEKDNGIGVVDFNCTSRSAMRI